MKKKLVKLSKVGCKSSSNLVKLIDNDFSFKKELEKFPSYI